MEITGVRLIERTGTNRDIVADEFYEERIVRPLDCYPEFRSVPASDVYLDPEFRPSDVAGRTDGDHLRMTHTFLHVETDAGITGVMGPVGGAVAAIVAGFEGLLVGRDPRETRKLWDLLYRHGNHGHTGKTVLAISAIDCALWDVRGKYHDEPVHRLLGGPVRETFPAYASMAGYSVEPEAVRERAAAFADRGFTAQKWFFRYGAGSGAEGVRRNVELARAARESVGDDYDLMFDAWMSWNPSFARRMFDRLEPLDPRWLEEPVHPHKVDQYAELAEDAPFPLSGGEHTYTRWEAHDLLERGGVDVLQPDPVWVGGITEMERVFSLASVRDVPVMLHGHSVPVSTQLIAAQPPDVCPLAEYVVKWTAITQFFLEDPVTPEDGTMTVPDRPGLGISIDDAVVSDERELEF